MERSAYDANNKDFYSKLFQSKNVSTSETYIKKFYIFKDGCKSYFEIRQHFMGDDAINRAKDKSYL